MKPSPPLVDGGDEGAAVEGASSPASTVAGEVMTTTIKRMWGRLCRALGLVGLVPARTGGARGSASDPSSLTDHERFKFPAADCTGIDGRPLASLLTPGEAEAGLRPGDHRFVGR